MLHAKAATDREPHDFSLVPKNLGQIIIEPALAGPSEGLSLAPLGTAINSRVDDLSLSRMRICRRLAHHFIEIERRRLLTGRR